MPERLEYRVRPVTRYIITRFEDAGSGSCDSRCLGEHDNEDTAYSVAYALCSEEHRRIGWEPGDTRIEYPLRPI